MLFADWDDPQQTMEAIIKLLMIQTQISVGGRIATWQDFRDKVDDLSQRSQPTAKGQQRVSNEHLC